MHPDNPFQENYPFKRLIKVYPALKKHVFVNQYGSTTIRFGDSEAVRSLNAALLKLYYDIDWSIPEGQLCPPIPGRLDYLLHLNGIVEIKTKRILDIGTGANLIYPILGACHFGWQMVGSEVDKSSLNHAKTIISKNPELQDIELRHQANRRQIFASIIARDDWFDAVVCNPPFFKGVEEAKRANARKVKNLGLNEKKDQNFGGTSNELWFTGGEEAFLKLMITESAQYAKQVGWFTSLVSRKEHLKTLQRYIRRNGASEHKTISMGQGNKMSRFIAWRY